MFTCIIATDGTAPVAGAYIYAVQTDSVARTWWLDDVQLVNTTFVAAPSAFKESSLQLNSVITSPVGIKNIAELLAEMDARQARIDALMLEYCPDEMMVEQRANWAEHQRPVDRKTQAAIDAALTQDKL